MVFLEKMHYCSNCYEKQPIITKVNTLERCNVAQCDKCFHVGNTLILYNYGEECGICLIIIYGSFWCSHWGSCVFILPLCHILEKQITCICNHL